MAVKLMQVFVRSKPWGRAEAESHKDCLCRAESHKDGAACPVRDCTEQESYCKWEMLIPVFMHRVFSTVGISMWCEMLWLISIALTCRKPNNIFTKVTNVRSASQLEPFIECFSSWGTSVITQNSAVINIAIEKFPVF